MKVVLLPQAAKDLDAIYDPVYSRVLKRLRYLSRMPYLEPAMVGPFADYRSTVVAMFRIVYRVVEPETVEIAYIRRCRRS